jgi:hypothetical protein
VKLKGVTSNAKSKLLFKLGVSTYYMGPFEQKPTLTFSRVLVCEHIDKLKKR